MKIPVVIFGIWSYYEMCSTTKSIVLHIVTFLEVRATLEQWVCSTGSYHLNAKSTMSFHQFTQFRRFCTASTKTCDAHACNAHFTGLARTWLFFVFVCKMRYRSRWGIRSFPWCDMNWRMITKSQPLYLCVIPDELFACSGNDRGDSDVNKYENVREKEGDGEETLHIFQ